jgi:phage shock protein PspC (stress-responsive transcriptional regulator)
VQKKIYRSENDRMLAGVCGGIGEYFDVDPTIIRILWVLIACTGAGLLAYIICAIIIPSKTELERREGTSTTQSNEKTEKQDDDGPIKSASYKIVEKKDVDDDK